MGTVEPLSEMEAHELFAAMLDGGVQEMELGALLAALHLSPRSAQELAGFHRAATERSYCLNAPLGRLRPLVIPAFGGARRQHNLLPLLAMLLARLGVPVLMQGPLDAGGRVGAVYILRELGVLPSATVAQAQQALDERLIAFLPVAALCPGLASLIGLQPRLGFPTAGHLVAPLMDPFGGEGMRLVGAASAAETETLGGFLAASGANALLLRSTEGDPFADPFRRPRIEFFADGDAHALFEEEAAPVDPVAGLPERVEAAATAGWIRQALAGDAPIPHPLVNQLACCLYACGYTDDMNQAKAIAAVETSSLSPVVDRRRRPPPRLPTPLPR